MARAGWRPRLREPQRRRMAVGWQTSGHRADHPLRHRRPTTRRGSARCLPSAVTACCSGLILRRWPTTSSSSPTPCGGWRKAGAGRQGLRRQLRGVPRRERYRQPRIGCAQSDRRGWLFSPDRGTIIDGIVNGRGSVMPAWSARLDDATIKALAVYVHGLGGGEK